MSEILDIFLAETSGPAALSTQELLLRLLIAFLAGQAIAWVYQASHGTLNYSQNFIQALVLLSMVVAVIMCVVGDSLARAFGLGAALAIVRFRTPIKDALDTAFLFLAVAVGMAAGVGAAKLALAAAATIGSAAVFLAWTSFGAPAEAEGLLRFRFASGSRQRETIADIVSRHCASFQLDGIRSAGDDEDELVYHIDLREREAAAQLVEDLKEAGGTSISLLPSARVQGG